MGSRKKNKKQTTSLEPPCLYSDCDSSPGCRTRVSGPLRCSGEARRQGRTAYGQQVARSLKFHHLLLPVGEAAEALQLLRLGHGSVGKHLQILSRVTPSQLVFLPSQNCTFLRLNSFSTLAAAATRTAVATRLVTRLLEEPGGDVRGSHRFNLTGERQGAVF